jgi:hypothetical protein
MLIQVILVATAVILLAVFIRSPHTQRTLAVKRIAFILFMLASCYMVLRPSDTSWLAHKLGVGRGTDLVLYLLVVAFGFFAANTYLRFRTLEKRFTDLVRAVALGAVEVPAQDGASASVGRASGGAASAVAASDGAASEAVESVTSGTSAVSVSAAVISVPEQAGPEKPVVIEAVPGQARRTA